MTGARHRPATARMALVIAAALVASTVFYTALLFSGPLDHFDWSSRVCHYFDWVRISLVHHHSLPLYMVDARVSKNFIANPEAPTLGPLLWLLPVLGTDAYLKLLIVVFSAGGLVGMFLLLRDFDVDPALATAPAVAFAFNGFITAHLGVGHHWAMGAQLLPGLLLLLRRAVLRHGGAVWWAALLNAFSILGGQHQSFIWQNLVLGAYALLFSLQGRSFLPLRRLGEIVAWTAALAALKLFPMLAEFGDYDPSVHTPGLPLDQLFFALAGRGQGPATRVSGLEFVGGAGWWEYACYVGPVMLVCLAAGVLALRRVWPLVLIGSCFLMISIDGSSGVDLWSRMVDLPLWRSQRSPSRFLFIALFALLVAAGVGLQRPYAWLRERRPRVAAAAAGALAALIFVDLRIESQDWQAAAVGKPLVSRSHQPRRTQLRIGTKAVATLHEFAPNRMVYRVTAKEAVRIVFPLRYAKNARERQRRGENAGASDWRIDGLPAIAEDGKLAVDVPPGTRDVVLSYRPRFFCIGAATSAASLLALGVAIRRSRRSVAATGGC